MENLLRRINITVFLCLAFLGSNSQHHWQGLPGYNFSRYINSLCVDTMRDKLYIGGDFRYVNGYSYNGICQWDGVFLQPMSCGVNGCTNICFGIDEMVMFNGNLFALYRSDSIGCTSAFAVAEWDGSQWNDLNQKYYINENLVYPRSIFSFDSIFVVNGMIDSVNNLKVTGQIQFDGNVWSSFLPCPLFNGPMYGKYRIIKYKGVFYADNQEFDTNGTQQLFSRWNGTCWEKVPGVFSNFNMSINKMIVFQDDLYIAGSFTPLLDPLAPGNNIARYDGVTWDDLSGGISGVSSPVYSVVFDMAVHNGYLYVAGSFNKAGGIPANGIARWDGVSWCSLDGEFDNIISSIAFFQDTLYIAGGFHTIDSDSIRFIARWTGGNYTDSCSAGVSVPELESSIELNLHPNPARDKLYFTCAAKGFGTAEVSVYNSIGKQVYLQRESNASDTERTIDISSFPSGLYLLNISYGDSRTSEKFLIIR